jgi:uncharacterized membrane protein
LIAAQQFSFMPETSQFQAEITQIIEQGQRQDGEQSIPFQKLLVTLTTGPAAGQTVTITTTGSDSSNPLSYQLGDTVWVTQTGQLDLAPASQPYVITDFVRGEPLLVLSLLFAGLVIAIGKWRGLLSLLALVLSFGVLVKVTLPLILLGWNPILVSILTAGLILPTNFYFSHGWNLKTHVAIISTILALTVTSFLAQLFITQTHLTGLASEEANFLLVEKPGLINLKSLVLAAVIVGALGILDDITVAQTSVVFELKKANQAFGWKELYQRGMVIGQDHISSMVNTLILVYAGAALPLLLLFTNNPHPLGEVLNLEIIAEEIVKTLVGSIGLIFAAPITTALAALVITQNWVPKKTLTETHGHHH